MRVLTVGFLLYALLGSGWMHLRWRQGVSRRNRFCFWYVSVSSIWKFDLCDHVYKFIVFLIGYVKKDVVLSPMYAWNHLGATVYEGSDCWVLAVCTFGFWLYALKPLTGRLTTKSKLLLICASIFEWKISFVWSRFFSSYFFKCISKWLLHYPPCMHGII